MEIKQISYAYDRTKQTLHSISGRIARGKITTIIGPNGSGKSTLLSIMSKNATPDSGQVILDGKSLQAYRAKELARKLAVVHQHNVAPSDLTVEKLVGYGRIPHRERFASGSEEDQQAIEWALACTNLLGKRSKTLDALSGGERQRVWIAMALAQKTPFLFLDEPTTYLDMYYQYEILELIRRINREHGMTVVMVLHDINQAIRYSDRIIAMKDGRVVIQGEPEQVITRETLLDIYGMETIVRTDPEAGLYIVPVGLGHVR
jgi:iron complex transport system ATP-binding protein